MGGIRGLHTVTGLQSLWDHTQVVATAALWWLDTGSSGRTSCMASGEAAFYVGEQREYVEIYCGTGEEPAGSLWIRVSRQTNVGHVVCICYKPPGQEEGEVSFRYLEGASDSQDLIPVGDLIHAVACWRGGTAGHKGSGMLLVCVADNFLTQVIKELTKGGTPEGLQSHNQGSVCSRSESWGSLACRDHEVVE